MQNTALFEFLSLLIFGIQRTPLYSQTVLVLFDHIPTNYSTIMLLFKLYPQLMQLCIFMTTPNKSRQNAMMLKIGSLYFVFF